MLGGLCRLGARPTDRVSPCGAAVPAADPFSGVSRCYVAGMEVCGECGIQAMGRCPSCGRSVCRAHMALAWPDLVPPVRTAGLLTPTAVAVVDQSAGQPGAYCASCRMSVVLSALESGRPAATGDHLWDILNWAAYGYPIAPGQSMNSGWATADLLLEFVRRLQPDRLNQKLSRKFRDQDAYGSSWQEESGRSWVGVRLPQNLFVESKRPSILLRVRSSGSGSGWSKRELERVSGYLPDLQQEEILRMCGVAGPPWNPMLVGPQRWALR